jgi:hypothetical protein
MSFQDLAHRMDVIPHIWVTTDDESFTLRMEGISFGGSLKSLENEVESFSTWTLVFGGLTHHFLALDVTLDG